MVIHVNIRKVNIFLLWKLTILSIPRFIFTDFRHRSPSHRIGSALSVTEIPQEFVDAIIAKTTSKCGVFHLFVAQNNHGRVTEASHIYSLLQIHLSHALGPQPAPVLLLVLVSKFGKRFQVGVATGGVTVQDVRQESDHTQRMFLASFLHLGLGQDLNHLWRFNVIRCLLLAPSYDVGGTSPTVILLWLA